LEPAFVLRNDGSTALQGFEGRKRGASPSELSISYRKIHGRACRFGFGRIAAGEEHHQEQRGAAQRPCGQQVIPDQRLPRGSHALALSNAG
jgi:hypothetical protein